MGATIDLVIDGESAGDYLVNVAGAGIPMMMAIATCSQGLPTTMQVVQTPGAFICRPGVSCEGPHWPHHGTWSLSR